MATIDLGVFLFFFFVPSDRDTHLSLYDLGRVVVARNDDTLFLLGEEPHIIIVTMPNQEPNDEENVNDEPVETDADAADASSSQPPPPPMLSKSWAVAKQHVPTFTGGKITHSKRGLPGSSNSNDKNSAALDFMLLPVAGDVAIVDAQHGVTLGTLRGNEQGKSSSQGFNTAAIMSGNQPDNDDDDHDDDEDDELDVNAITAYALSHNDQVVVTCSRH